VLGEACRQAAAWQRPGDEPITVSVNLAATELQQSEIVEQVERVLMETGLQPGCLKLEITEGVLIEHTDAVLETLHDLRKLGVTLVLDDFGTGYSSLSYLTRFPVQTLKIDRTFVAGLSCDRGARAIVRAIVTLAGGLDLDTTVEGIETAEQLAFVRDLDCCRGQGFYFWRPLSPEHAAGVLRQQREHGHSS
jgi:EAL domain-containing protein (putative c-di-GMP-specific phosphodiesterase class I)